MRAQAPRAVWALAAVVVAGWLAVVEVFWLPLRVGGMRMPLSVVAAVVGNLLLPAAALRFSGSRLVAVLPVLAWVVVAVAAMMRRPEGDLVLNGVGVAGAVSLAFLMLGVLAAAVSVGRILGGVLGGARPLPVTTESVRAPDPTGSGTGGAR